MNVSITSAQIVGTNCNVAGLAPENGSCTLYHSNSAVGTKNFQVTKSSTFQVTFTQVQGTTGYSVTATSGRSMDTKDVPYPPPGGGS